MRAVVAIIFVAAVAAGTGCGPRFHHPTPKGFVELPAERSYDYRAISADGLVLAARRLDHEPRGELAFWTRAIGNHLRHTGGYALLESRDVKTAGGMSGVQLRFGHDESKHPHLYYVTVFVTDAAIYLLEAGGTRELMEAGAEQVEWAVHNFRID